MIRYIIFAFVLLELGFVQSKIVQKDLVQLSVITRHGQRTPEGPFPKDPWTTENVFPEGWMQITAEGSQQMKTLGELLRKRYTLTIPVDYKTEDLLVRSSNTARTLDSASALLSGLYPNQSIPIHVSPKHCDPIFFPNVNCPTFDEEINMLANLPGAIQDEKNNEPLYQWLTLKLGKTIRGLHEIEKLYTNFVIEEQKGLELPEWAQSVYPEPLRSLAGKFVSKDAISEFSRRIRFGTILNKILTDAADVGTKNVPSIFIYSAHDTTLAGLLKTLNFYDGFPPGFAAAFILEVHQDLTSKEKEFRFFYRNESRSDLQQLYVPQCDTPCSLSQLVKILKPILVENLNLECRRADNMQEIIEDATKSVQVERNYIQVLIFALGAVLIFSSLACVVKYLICDYVHAKKGKYTILSGNNNPHAETSGSTRKI